MRFLRKGKFLVLTASFFAIFLFSGVCRAYELPNNTFTYSGASLGNSTRLTVPSGQVYTILGVGLSCNDTNGGYIASSQGVFFDAFGSRGYQYTPSNVVLVAGQTVYVGTGSDKYCYSLINYVKYDLSTIESNLDVAKQTNGYLFAIIVGVAVFALIRYIFHLISSMALGW